jgi:hypothetical protein
MDAPSAADDGAACLRSPHGGRGSDVPHRGTRRSAGSGRREWHPEREKASLPRVPSPAATCSRSGHGESERCREGVSRTLGCESMRVEHGAMCPWGVKRD